MQGWIGCTLCILGATILALNAPEQQSVTTIEGFQHLFLSPGFLVWGSLLIVTSAVLIFYVAPRWGKKNMMPYISICSLIGGISVSCTQGIGGVHRHQHPGVSLRIRSQTLTMLIYNTQGQSGQTLVLLVPLCLCHCNAAARVSWAGRTRSFAHTCD